MKFESARGRELAPGFVLRSAAAHDVSRIGDLIEICLPLPQARGAQAAWVRDLASGSHSAAALAELTVVEDESTRKIVSTIASIPQSWNVGGVELRVCVPELIATLPSCRNRGFIRAQFELHHARSVHRGDDFQAVEGLLNFYGQFGYEPAIDTEHARIAYIVEFDAARNIATTGLDVRRALPSDAATLARYTSHKQTMQTLVTVCRDARQWRYEIEGRSQTSSVRYEIDVLTDSRRIVGYLTYEPRLRGTALRVLAAELKTGNSWLASAPLIFDHLRRKGQAMAKATRGGVRFDRVEFVLEPSHPLLVTTSEHLAGVVPPIAWYIRTSDLRKLVKKLAPVLEHRLASSLAEGHSSTLSLSFVRDGLMLAFVRGRLTDVTKWDPLRETTHASAVFPGRTFLQLLFGYRSLAELRAAHADCWVWDGSEVLLNALFPRLSSHIWPIL